LFDLKEAIKIEGITFFPLKKEGNNNKCVRERLECGKNERNKKSKLL